MRSPKQKKHKTPAPPRPPKPDHSQTIHCAYDRMEEIDDLQPNPRNPNKHPQKQIALLAKIIRHQGWRSPVVVSKRSGLIVSGHGRYEAAKLLQLAKVPVNFQEFATDEDETAHLLADNRIAELSETNQEELQKLLAELDAEMTFIAGFDPAELDEQLAAAEKNSAEQTIPEAWQILIECKDEEEQTQLLEELTEKKVNCRALTS